jgi:hypothetical protein
MWFMEIWLKAHLPFFETPQVKEKNRIENGFYHVI